MPINPPTCKVCKVAEFGHTCSGVRAGGGILAAKAAATPKPAKIKRKGYKR